MELDDLKENWNKTENNTIKNTDIMNLIQHKSYGPLAALKKGFRKQIIVMSILPIFLFVTNADDFQKVLSSVMFWSYVAFCMAVVISSAYNYRLVGEMEIMDGLVKSRLEQQITLLEKRINRTITGLRITLIYFILLTEVVPYFQHYRMLEKWHAVNPVIRYSTYASLLLLQYFFSRRILERKFGSHLKYLKKLVKEME